MKRIPAKTIARIRKLRKSGTSVEATARLTGVCRATVTNYTKHTTPTEPSKLNASDDTRYLTDEAFLSENAVLLKPGEGKVPSHDQIAVRKKLIRSVRYTSPPDSGGGAESS